MIFQRSGLILRSNNSIMCLIKTKCLGQQQWFRINSIQGVSQVSANGKKHEHRPNYKNDNYVFTLTKQAYRVVVQQQSHSLSIRKVQKPIRLNNILLCVCARSYRFIASICWFLIPTAFSSVDLFMAAWGPYTSGLHPSVHSHRNWRVGLMSVKRPTM